MLGKSAQVFSKWCRNPLYLFSLCGALGVGFATETFTIPAIIAVAFAFYYPFVISAEEKELAAVHGQEYAAYVKRVPRFWPRRLRIDEPGQYVVNPRAFRKSMFDALWFVWLVELIEFAEAFREAGILPIAWSLY